jgi:adenylate cyclase
MNSLFKKLLALRQMEYLTLDQGFTIAAISPGAKRFADPLEPLVRGKDYRLVLPELVGMEDVLIAVLQGEQPDFSLEAIVRPLENGSLLYFDLCITRLEEDTFPGSVLILFLEDVTERRTLEQSLVQASNEMSLLLNTLSTSNHYIEKIITSMADALFVTTTAGIIKTVNQAAQDLLGYSQEELIHQPFSTIVADENFLPQAIQPSLNEGAWKDVEVICRTKTGEKISIAFACSVIQTELEGLNDFLYVGRDITDRQRSQQRLMAQYATARVLSQPISLKQAAAKILPALCQSLEWDLVEFWTLEGESGKQQAGSRKEHGLQPEGFRSASPLRLSCVEIWSKPTANLHEFITLTKQMTFSSGVGLPGQVLANRSPKWVTEIASDVSFVRSSIATKAGLNSAFGFPIQSGGEVLGVITLFSREVRPPDPDLLQTMVVIGSQLSQFIQRKQAEIALQQQQEQTEQLLLNVLPEPIVNRLKQEPGTIAEHFSEATVLFADLVDFTHFAARLSPIQLVDLLNQIFSAFDRLCELHELEKIKTIGDAYMVVGGLPTRRADHAHAIAAMALDMQTELARFNAIHAQNLSMRIGIHSGPVVAGVIGIKKFTYDLWGDTVNTASRMESQGLAEQIQVTAATHKYLQDHYHFQERGHILIKGKGEMMTYLLLNEKTHDPRCSSFSDS